MSADNVVGTSELARMYGRSREWARMLLKRWYAEQKAGGEVRVIAYRDTKGRQVLKTTRATLARHMPPGRDLALVRQANRLDKDLDFLSQRVDRLMDLEKRVANLERMLGRPARR